MTAVSQINGWKKRELPGAPQRWLLNRYLSSLMQITASTWLAYLATTILISYFTYISSVNAIDLLPCAKNALSNFLT